MRGQRGARCRSPGMPSRRRLASLLRGERCPGRRGGLQPGVGATGPGGPRRGRTHERAPHTNSWRPAESAQHSQNQAGCMSAIGRPPGRSKPDGRRAWACGRAGVWGQTRELPTRTPDLITLGAFAGLLGCWPGVCCSSALLGRGGFSVASETDMRALPAARSWALGQTAGRIPPRASLSVPSWGQPLPYRGLRSCKRTRLI